MPIQIIWGNDIDACNNAIEKIIDSNISKTWLDLNLSKFNGEDSNQVLKAFEEIETPPFGEGSRVVLLKNNPIFNIKNDSYLDRFETSLSNIPDCNYLILQNTLKPDKRIKTTKLIQSSNNKLKIFEDSFNLPDMWNREAQITHIESIAKNIKIKLEDNVSEFILDSIGTESSNLVNELEKAKLFVLANDDNGGEILLSKEIAKKIFNDHQTNIFRIIDFILNKNIPESLVEINHLLNKGESPIKLIASLINQIRSHTIVFFLMEEKDTEKISKIANISNPKRIFYMRKKVRNCSHKYLIRLMIKLLNIERQLKRGEKPMSVFTENLITLT